MAINRAMHPITDAEIIECLEREAERIEKDVAQTKRMGDTRPELLHAAAKRIREIAEKE
ncbi:hypothetical protein [Salipiger sp. PrR003]|uniref:hypothetical protein n=1 Tax=Salipiger sp. PrR003 TaxID=2706776 RepID=UPI0013DB461E|nr:hypothetical protein [Salipiger sp. PrR003]NDV51526.1 hypothetical protein [Salipiger sp. PrR003]